MIAMLINAQFDFTFTEILILTFFLDQMCNLDSNNNSQFSNCKTERLIRCQSYINLP